MVVCVIDACAIVEGIASSFCKSIGRVLYEIIRGIVQ